MAEMLADEKKSVDEVVKYWRENYKNFEQPNQPGLQIEETKNEPGQN